MTCVLQPQRERGGRDKEREREREREKEKARERERMKGGGRKKTWRNVMWATKVHRRLGTMSLRMTCAISFYYGNSHTHCGKRLGTIIPWTRRNATLLYRDAFTHRIFYTQTLSHRDVFHAHTHRRISTQRLLHENTLTHRRFYTQTLLHTYAFTCRCLFTDAHTLSHTNAFTHRRFCTQTQTLFHTDPFTHRRFYTQTLLHTYAFTHGRFYTQTLLHTGAFTHRRFHTQTLLHTDAFPHRPFYTQTLLPLGDLSCKQRCANIVAMEMLKNRKSAQDQAQYHDQRTIQCKASALWDTK